VFSVKYKLIYIYIYTLFRRSLVFEVFLMLTVSGSLIISDRMINEYGAIDRMRIYRRNSRTLGKTAAMRL
jgi:hypothetical protein